MGNDEGERLRLVRSLFDGTVCCSADVAKTGLEGMTVDPLILLKSNTLHTVYGGGTGGQLS